ncbi:MAG TPA: anti-sigma regulatory factor [Opitutaceae bacterium]|jgi:serine/threonine-protein kinase RsbT|nr:anti-sigma regulatory factor [Opitutaceae bacterium]HXA81332.1 anti-sigma regulatory factor [Opitutaceae bacterium]
MSNEVQTEIRSAVDIVAARQQGRTLALELGFSGTAVTLIAAAISEVARNIVDHAKKGVVTMSGVSSRPGGGKHGIRIIARDEGPGIPDVAQAMQYGYSTRKGLGVGLPGAKWLMDEFEIVSQVGKGTTVTMIKWLH